MNHQKCPNCGFINFLTAEACRKCETVLISTGHDEQPVYDQTSQGYGYQNYYPIRPPRRKVPIFKICAACFLMLIAVGSVRTFVWYKSRFQWQDFRPTQSSLTIMMPGQPDASGPVVYESEAGTLTANTYTYLVPEQGSLMVGVVKGIPVGFPGSTPNPKVMHASLDNLLSQTNSTLVSKRDTYDHSFPALEFEIKPPGDSSPRKNRGFGKMIFTNGGLYILTVVAYENTQLFYERARFLNPPERYGNAY